MLGILRRCCSFLVQFVMRLVRPFKSSKVPPIPAAPSQEDWGGVGWDQEGDDWEPFSVRVVPNEKCDQDEQEVDVPREQPETDLFSDMEPVFRKPTKVGRHIVYNSQSICRDSIYLHVLSITMG